MSSGMELDDLCEKLGPPAQSSLHLSQLSEPERDKHLQRPRDIVGR